MPYSPVLGQIMPFAGTVVPRGWAPCNGQLLSIQQNQALFSLLGTYYGGNGTTNFALPDLRGRAILGSTGNAGQYPVGMTGGSVTVTLALPQLPAHNHLVQVSAAVGGGRGDVPPTNNVFATNALPASNPHPAARIHIVIHGWTRRLTRGLRGFSRRGHQSSSPPSQETRRPLLRQAALYVTASTR